MQTFKEFIDEDGLDYFIIQLNEEQVPEPALLNEGQWVPSEKKDWMQRVDAENPSIKQQRHVHVARAKHNNTKTMQAAWNQDLSKHDKKSFNSKIGSLNVVQSVARQALDLPDDAVLEEATKAGKVLIQLNESLENDIGPILFKLQQA